MGTFYGYAERSLENQVNWAEVGKSVSDTIQEEVRIREEKKQAIDDATRDLINEVGDTVTGLHRGANETILNYSSNTQDLILERQRLLKAGQINPKDYLMFMQNINDSTDTTFTLAQEYQDFYKVKMDRRNAGDSQALEVFTMGQAEGFANLENHALIPDPVTGLVVAYETELVDGVRRPIKGTGRSVNTIKNYITQDFNRYDVSGAVQDAVGGLGDASATYLEAAKKAGDLNILATISDPSMSGLTDEELEAFIENNFGGKKLSESEKEYLKQISVTYNDWEKNTIASMTSFDYNSTSILTENIGTAENKLAYDYTYDAKEAAENENLILLTDAKDQSGKPVPDFSTENGEKQKTRINAYLENQIRSSLDRSIERKAAGAKSYDPDYSARAQYNRGDTDTKEQDDVVSNVAQLYYGNKAQVTEAEKFLRAINPSIRSVSRTNKGVVINFRPDEDGTTRTETLDFDAPIAEWVRGSTNFFLTSDAQIKDVGSVLEKSGAKGRKDTKPNNVAGTITSQAKEEKKEGVLNAFERVLNESVEGFIGELGDAGADAVFTSDTDDKKAASNIQGFINSLPLSQGIKVDTQGYDGEKVYISNDDGILYTLDLKAANLDPERILKEIGNAVSNSFKLKEKAAVASTKRGTVTTGANSGGTPR